MPDQRVGEDDRKCHRQKQPERTSDDRAHDQQIRHQSCRRPPDECHHIGETRQKSGDEQKRRRIVPGKTPHTVLAEDGDLRLLLNIPIVGGGGLPLKHQPSCRPHVDEIGGNAQALGVDHPLIGDRYDHEKRGVHHEQRQACIQQQRRNGGAI